MREISPYVPVISIAYILIPVYIVMIRGKWTFADVGLTWRVKSTGVAIFAVTLGLISGVIAYISSQAVIGSDPLSFGTLLLLLFTNDKILLNRYVSVILSRNSFTEVSFNQSWKEFLDNIKQSFLVEFCLD